MGGIAAPGQALRGKMALLSRSERFQRDRRQNVGLNQEAVSRATMAISWASQLI